MTTSVHPAGILAGIGQAGGLQDRQRVHVGPQANRTLPIPVSQHPDDTGLADAAMHLDSPLLQLLRDKLGGAVLLQPQFRMGMDIAANGGQLILIEAGPIEHGWVIHGLGHQQVLGLWVKPGA